jgi:hypothetical protein
MIIKKIIYEISNKIIIIYIFFYKNHYKFDIHHYLILLKYNFNVAIKY